jgi:FMN phosphatase YigB (HAD superfamily)
LLIGGEKMVYVLAQLKLVSYPEWKKSFDKRKSTRQEKGSKEAHLFLNSDDHNEALILFDWDNMENARMYMEAEDLREYLKKAGAEIIKITYLDEQETSV